jgi:L-cysteine desulfidase
VTVKTVEDAKKLADNKKKMYAYLHPVIMYISSDLYENEKIDCVEIYVEDNDVIITIELDDKTVLPVIDKYIEYLVSKEGYEVCADLVNCKKRILARNENIVG